MNLHVKIYILIMLLKKPNFAPFDTLRFAGSRRKRGRGRGLKPRRERLGLSGRGFKGGFCSFPIGCVRVVTYNRRYKYEHTQPECIMKESYDYGWNHTYDYGWNRTHD